MHTDLPWPEELPACMTRHGNTNRARTFHPNTIFVSRKHANNHGAEAFVHLGLDPREYGEPDFDAAGADARSIFLGKAACNYAAYDRRAIHEHWRNGFTYRDRAGKYAAYYERILGGEDLHP